MGNMLLRGCRGPGDIVATRVVASRDGVPFGGRRVCGEWRRGAEIVGKGRS